MVRRVDFSTNTSVPLASSTAFPISWVGIIDSTETVILAGNTAPDVFRVSLQSDGVTPADCAIGIYSFPVAGYDISGNYYTALPTGAKLFFAYNVGGSEQFNCHATVIVSNSLKYTAPVEGTTVAESGAWGGTGVPSGGGGSTYPWFALPSGLAHTDDFAVFAFMTCTSAGTTTTGVVAQPVTDVNSNYGTAQDSRNTWTTPGIDLAFVVATVQDPATTGDHVHWQMSPFFSQNWVGVSAAYLKGPVSRLHFNTTPTATRARLGQTATFTAAAVAGTGTLLYQWQSSTDGGTTWADIAGATSSSYTTPPVTATDSGSLFRVIISDDD